MAAILHHKLAHLANEEAPIVRAIEASRRCGIAGAGAAAPTGPVT